MRSRGLASVLVLLAVGGCGPEDPYASNDQAAGVRRPATDPQGSARGLPEGELPGTVPQPARQQRVARPARDPENALREAAALYGNWSSATAPARFRLLAAMSIGEARAQLRQIAAQAEADTQQRGITSSSRVISVAVSGHGRRRRGEVVLRSRATGPSLPAQDTQVVVVEAAVARQGKGWVITRWEPQP